MGQEEGANSGLLELVETGWGLGFLISSRVRNAGPCLFLKLRWEFYHRFIISAGVRLFLGLVLTVHVFSLSLKILLHFFLLIPQEVCLGKWSW